MKIIHCGDIHLDSKLTSNFTKEVAQKRREELRATFFRMIQYAVNHQVEAVLICGDLFDSDRVTKETREMVTDAIRNTPEISYFYVRGNHDRSDVLMQETLPNLHVFGERPECYRVGMVNILGMELSKTNKELLANMQIPNAHEVNIVMLHGMATYYGDDSEESICLRDLKNKSIEYLALGHIHSYEEKALDSAGVYCYCGCLEPRGFDEPGEKGFVLLDIDEDARHRSREFIPFSTRTLYEVSVDVTDCYTNVDMLHRIMGVLKGQMIEPRNMVFIRLTGDISVTADISTTFLESQLSEMFFAVKVEDATEYKVEVEDFKGDLSLRGDFVRLVLAEESLSEEERAAIVRYGLQALSGEEIR